MNIDIENFLKSNIKCFNCGEGPISFSMTYDDNNNLISAYGDFCSMGCNLDFYIYSRSEKNMEKNVIIHNNHKS